MPTERLYYHDSHLYDFTAHVTNVRAHAANLFAVTLNRTAFYPTGGGQPHDTGLIDDVQVIDCLNADDIDEDTANVTHIVEASASEVQCLSSQAEVSCRVNRVRRFDHVQQHTAQHILSRAFLELYDAPTHGFRMMPEYAEVDIKLADATDERINDALELANKIVWENRLIKIHFMAADEIRAHKKIIRQRFERAGVLRVIEIEGFDFNPCGGTHAKQTGEVGVIFIPTWERAKGLARLTFVAGRRAFDDYVNANKTARDTAKLFSVGREEATEAARRLQSEHKLLQRRARTLEEIAADVEADYLVENSTLLINNTRIVIKVFSVKEKDAAQLRTLAHALAKRPFTIALLASVEGENARFVFARTKDLTDDMNKLMQEVCTKLDGRGGGTHDLAQGGGNAIDNLQQLLHQCLARIGDT